MGRIVAVSGGDLSSTELLNKHTVKLTNKAEPEVVFISTASGDDEGYIAAVTDAFRRLNCKVKALRLCSGEYDSRETDALLSRADIIYVGGGDTVSMMRIWKEHGLDKKLKRIYENDSAVLSGLSAGAICWFNCGYSDSEDAIKEVGRDYGWANGMLGIFHMAFCPHYDEEGRDSFDEALENKGLPGLAMENNTAFVENCGRQYFIKSVPDENAYRIKYVNGKIEKSTVDFAEA